MWVTQEGLYLTVDEKATSLRSSEVDLSAMHEMIVSDSDGSTIKTAKAIKQIKTRLCKHLAAFLKVLVLKSDVYATLRDSIGIDHVFYAYEGLVYLPKCMKVQNITIVAEDCETVRKF